MNHERCKICQWNKDGHTTPETCKKKCNYRYDYKRRIRICDLENKVKTLTEENNLLKEELYKKSEQNQSFQTAFEEIKKYKSTLEDIKSKWNELKKRSPLEICFYEQKNLYEIDKVINEVLK